MISKTQNEIMGKWETSADPLVSICSMTYNHEPFIRQCLDGFVMQETGFPFEILIHDDASTDKTAKIIMEYEKKHPSIFKPIFQAENQYSKGIKPNPAFNYPRAKGKYIALCEGDDYWTDPYKLQKQVDFLEAHDDYVLCAGISLKLDGKNFQDFGSSRTGTINFTDIAHGNFLMTNTVVYRNIFKNNESCKLSDYLQCVLNVDTFLFLSLLMKGKGYILPDCVGVYRMHDGGIFSKIPDKVKQPHIFRTKNILISYLQDINADDHYIKEVENGYLAKLENYLNGNILTEELMEIIPEYILNKTINKLMNDYHRQNELLQSNDSVAGLIAERNAALATIAEIKSSTSWRLTAPLRLLGHLVKGDFHAVISALTYVKKGMGI